MASYFESINDALTVQINDDFSNYALWKKGRSRARNGPASTSVLYQISFDYPAGSIPIVVYDTQTEAGGRGLLVLSEAMINGKANLSIYSSDIYTPAAQQTIDFYIYLPANDPAVTVQPRGLFTLWNAAGRVVYDSEANYLKVIDYVNHHYAAQAYSKTYNVSRIGMSVSNPHWFVNSANSPGGWNQVAGTTVLQGVDGLPNRASFVYTPFRYMTSSSGMWPQPTSYGNQALGALICDITNLTSLPYDIDQQS